MQALRKKHSACRIIQSEWRVLRMRQRALRRVADARSHRAKRFANLQSTLRTSWEAIREAHRVIIHLPGVVPQASLADGSPCASDGTGRPLPSVRALETAQLPRVCDAADPLTDVVFVVSKPLPMEVEEYWRRMLEAGGVEAPASARFTVVHAENAPRLPQRMPLAAKVLASPGAMRRLAGATRGRAAFIMPGGVGDADVELAVALGVPLLGAAPAVAAAVSMKSGARSVLRQARVNVPPGVTILPVEGQPAVGAGAGALAADGSGDTGAAAGATELPFGSLSMSGAEQKVSRGLGVVRLATGSAGKLTFTLAGGQLDVVEAPTPPPRHERKDRLLCEHIASAMLQPGTRNTKVCRYVSSRRRACSLVLCP